MTAIPTWRLTQDGELTVTAPPAVIAGWLPLGRSEGTPGRAALTIAPSPAGLVPPSGPPTLRLLDVSAWISRDGLVLRDASGAADARVDLGALHGEIGANPGAFLEPLVTVSAALLLGRLGRALIHAAGVVAPDGRAWLLAGDSHAGKSTTLATLVRGGWSWLADDQVIVRSVEGQLVVEGWPRPLNLDAGYSTGQVTGVREAVEVEPMGAPDPAERTVAGVLLMSLDAERPTRVTGASSADAFAALVRQSPWLLADLAVAPAITGLLAAAAALPTASLTLGRDCYGRPDILLAALDPLFQRR